MNRELTLQQDDATLHVDHEAGGRVSQLEVAGLALLAHVDRDSIYHWGCFVMAPWAGRIRRGRFQFGARDYQLPVNGEPHAIHGTVLDRPWEVVEATTASALLQCSLDDRWPWRGYVRHVIRIQPGAAEFRIEVHAGDAPFPAAAGWHPWFRRRLARGGLAELSLDAESMLRRDEDGIPSGERVPVPPGPWDDCFDHVRWPTTLTWPGALRLEITADTRYGVVYTEPENAVCVEPQTGPPDALNLEPVEVRPDQPLVARMTWAWSALTE